MTESILNCNDAKLLDSIILELETKRNHLNDDYVEGLSSAIETVKWFRFQVTLSPNEFKKRRGLYHN